MGATGVNSDDGSRVPLLTAVQARPVPGVVYGFTTRVGGVSPSPRDSLNLAVRPGSQPDDVAENWRRTLRALEPGLRLEDLALLSQVHGARVVRARAGAGPLDTIAEADGAWTDVAGVALGIRTADCVPVVLMHPAAVGVAHAGWRGTVAGIVDATVSALCHGARVRPDELVAVIGPHIGGAAYEVGAEVVDGLRGAGVPEDDFLVAAGGSRPHVDLGAAVAAQLREAGVRTTHRIARCTSSDPALYSHRRDGPLTGRLAGVVARVP